MTNIRLTYDYTLNSIKVVKDSINQLKTKLTLILTISGVLVNFGKDLPAYIVSLECNQSIYPCLSCYLLKFLAYLFTIITIGLGLWGLSPVVGGEIILPEQLLAEEWNQAEEEDYLTALIQYLQTETLVIISKIREQKAIRLNWAIRTIVTAVILFLLDEMIFISIPVLGKFCAGI
ncbi:MAG: hypothetical protein ACK5UO_13040 [Microcystis sp.]|jgi:hypothetical protein|uniref:hypothetical protein n=1 Tax=Microcystis sp. TaxID=1127 RepID=UPI00391BDAFB